jgi:hypothetical protein
MRWLGATIALFVIIGLVLLLADNLVVAVWDGRFPMQVNLLGTKDRGIVEVACDTLDDQNYAGYVRTAPERLDLDMKVVDWIEGEPFSVHVRTSGRTSGLFGRESSYFQHQLLVVGIMYKDGGVQFIPVEIPDGRVSRQVSVSIPERSPCEMERETKVLHPVEPPREKGWPRWGPGTGR